MQTTSNNIKEEAKKTYDESTELQTKYEIVQTNLTNKLDTIKNSKERAENLFARALDLMAKVSKTEKEMNALDNKAQEEKLKNLESVIEKLISDMTNYIQVIEAKSTHYNVCT